MAWVYTCDMSKEAYVRSAETMLKEVHRRGMAYSAKPSLLAHAGQKTCNELEVRLQACLGATRPEQLERSAKSLRDWVREHQNFLRSEGIAEPSQINQIALRALATVTRPVISAVDEVRPADASKVSSADIKL